MLNYLLRHLNLGDRHLTPSAISLEAYYISSFGSIGQKIAVHFGARYINMYICVYVHAGVHTQEDM